MAAWDQNAARTSLRTLLADNDGDKFEFKVPLYPVPDGVTKHFSLGRINIVEGSLSVYLNAEILDEVDIVEADTDRGTVELLDAPPVSGSLLASFGYRWFTDEQLDEALLQGLTMLNFGTVPEVTPVGLRSIALDFGAYEAYMMQAALAAEELVVTAGGYEAHQSRSHPNWRELARLRFEKAQSKLKLYLETAIGEANPGMAFTAYRLPNWQGP